MPLPIQIKKIKGISNPLIRKRYLKYFQLPQDLRQILFAVETADKIRQIGQKNNLNDDQLWWASYVTGMVILGETNIVDFVKTLQEKCKLSSESARQLARDINQAIFLPVKESLKLIHQVPSWPREEESTNEPISPYSSESASTRIKKNEPPRMNQDYRESAKETSQAETVKPRLKGNIVDLKNG